MHNYLMEKLMRKIDISLLIINQKFAENNIYSRQRRKRNIHQHAVIDKSLKHLFWAILLRASKTESDCN